jgi:hypothetical protein
MAKVLSKDWTKYKKGDTLDLKDKSVMLALEKQGFFKVEKKETKQDKE